MKSRGNTFRVDLGAIERIADKLGHAEADYDRDMEKKTKTATNMVWRIAHQRRPYISKEQMKKEGRSKRVSDPTAELGVPVQTGRLQQSVKQFVERIGLMKFKGTIETRGVNYAGFVEYGTSRMKARPFMRPAVALTKSAIKSLFGLVVTHKV